MTRTIREALGSGSPASGMKTDPEPIMYMDTIDAYNKWAEVYDKDGNFLQALDTIEMQRLLPLFMARVTTAACAAPIFPTAEQHMRLVDLGCGTGRNTVELLKSAPAGTEIIGLDASLGMLEVARTTLLEHGAEVVVCFQPGEKERNDQSRGSEANTNITRGKKKVILDKFDFLAGGSPDRDIGGAAGVISTLVLEHIPVDTFFACAAALLRPGGYLLITNMHAEMGAISQAGFVDLASGVKIRPTSYAHTVGDVLSAAERAGFVMEVLGDGVDEGVRERRVDETMLEALGPRGKKWVGVMVWFGVCFRKDE